MRLRAWYLRIQFCTLMSAASTAANCAAPRGVAGGDGGRFFPDPETGRYAQVAEPAQRSVSGGSLESWAFHTQTIPAPSEATSRDCAVL